MDVESLKKTISLKKLSVGDVIVRFKCPNCGTEIIRSNKERSLGLEWVCPNCGFIGP